MTSQLAAKGSLLVRLISQKFHQYIASTPKDEPTPSRDPDNDNDSGLPGFNEDTSPSPQMKALDSVPIVPAAPTLDVNPNKFDHGDRFFLQTVDSILSDASSFDQSFDEYSTAQYDGVQDVKEEEIQDSMDEDEDLETSDVGERCSSPLSDKYRRLRVTRDLNRAKGQIGQEVKVQTPGQITDDSNGGDEFESAPMSLAETDKGTRSMSASANVVQNQAQEDDPPSDVRSTPGREQSVPQPVETNETANEDNDDNDDNEKDDQLDQQPNEDEIQSVDADTSFAEHEDRIFSSLDDAKRDELMMYIVQHPFVRQIHQQQACRRQFMQDIRREAGAAGMNTPDIDLLEKHVWRLYLQMFDIESAEPQAFDATEDTVVEKSSSVSKKKQDKEKRKREDVDDSGRKAKKKKNKVKEEKKADDADASSHKLEKKKRKEKRKSADAEESSRKSKKKDGKRQTLDEEESSEKVAKEKREKTKSHSRSPVPSDGRTDNVDVVASADEPAAPPGASAAPVHESTAPVDEPAAPTDETATPVQDSAAPVDTSMAPVVDLAATADETGPIGKPAASVSERAVSIEEIAGPVDKPTTSPEKSAAPVTINKPGTPLSFKKASASVTPGKYLPFSSRRTPSKSVTVQKRSVLGEVGSPIVIDSSDGERSAAYQESDDGDTTLTDCVIVKPEAVTTSLGLSSFPMSPVSLKAQALPNDYAGPKTPKSRKQQPQRSESPSPITYAAKADRSRPNPSQQEAHSQPVLGEVGSTEKSKSPKTKRHTAEVTSMHPEIVNIEVLDLHSQKPERHDQAASGDAASAKKSKSRKHKHRSSEPPSTGSDVAITTSPNVHPTKTEHSAQPAPDDAVGIDKSKSHKKKQHPSETSIMGTQYDSLTPCLSRPEKRALQPASANTLSTDTKATKSAAQVHSSPSPAPDKTAQQLRREKKREKLNQRRKHRRLLKKRAKANNGVLNQGQEERQTSTRETGKKKKSKASSKAMSKESSEVSFWKLDF